MNGSARFKFRDPRLMCSLCDKEVAKARDPDKWFRSESIVNYLDYEPTENHYRKSLGEGDLIICSSCYKERKKRLDQVPNKIEENFSKDKDND